MARMKELEEENRRLKKRYAGERLKAEIVAEALTKNGGAISAAEDSETFRSVSSSIIHNLHQSPSRIAAS